MKAYVAVYSEGGRLIYHTDNRDIIRQVALAMATTFPSTPTNDPTSEIQEARRRALRRIADGEGDDE